MPVGRAKSPPRTPQSPGKGGNNVKVPSIKEPIWAEQDGGKKIDLEWGSWTEDMQVSSHDGHPMVTSVDNKSVEHAPTARLGLALPDEASAEWKLLLVSAKGLVSVGLERRTVLLGTAYRKSENRDNVWYFTTDGILRNGARSVGKKGSVAKTNDVITVRFHNHALTFWINDKPFGDEIPDIRSGTFALSVQLHRKADKIALVSEKFDEWTLAHLKHFTWGTTSVLPDGSKACSLKVLQASRRSTLFPCPRLPAPCSTLLLLPSPSCASRCRGPRPWQSCVAATCTVGLFRQQQDRGP